MKAVAEQVQRQKVSALVVDPVLVATSGDSLADSAVAEAMKAHLFPLATVITPNLPEASALLGNRPVTDLESMKQVRLGCDSINEWCKGYVGQRTTLCYARFALRAFVWESTARHIAVKLTSSSNVWDSAYESCRGYFGMGVLYLKANFQS